MHFLNRSFSLAAIAVAVSFLVFGCSESRIAQCNKLVTIVNKSKSLSVPKSNAEMSQLADSMDKLRTEIQAVKLNDETLKGFQVRILEMYAGASQALRNKANPNNDLATTNSAGEALKNTAAKESPLADEIDKYCSGK